MATHSEALTGEMFIGAARVRGAAGTFRGHDPARGAWLEPAYGGGTSADVERACQLAWEAFDAFRDTDLETRARLLDTAAQRLDPNVVKVVTDRHGFGLYFSRHPIPFPRAVPDVASPGASSLQLRHLGLYAYRHGTLRRLTEHPAVQLEQAERLEQLRALWLGFRVFVKTVPRAPGHGVDTEADLQRVEAMLRERGTG